jgi:hypothetical protein
MVNYKPLTPVLAFAGLAACGSLTGNNVCNAVDRPALIITVRDAASGGPTASNSRTIVARHGGATDTVIVAADATLDAEPVSAFDEPGTYDVRVNKIGYATWLASGVVVAQDKGQLCQPVTVSLRADLERQP